MNRIVLKTAFVGVIVFFVTSLTFLSLSVSGIFEGPAGAAERFFKLVAEEEQQAYQMTSDRFQEVTSVQDFLLFIESYPTLDFATVSFFEQTYKDDSHVLLSGKVTDEKNILPVLIELTKEGAAWKVTYISINESE